MHTPQEELFFGVISPEAALFDKTFSVDGAAREHEAYMKALRDHIGNQNVHTLTGILLAGTDRPGPARDALIDLADEIMTLNVEELGLVRQELEKAKHQLVLERMSPDVLVRIILQQPTVKLRSNEDNTPSGIKQMARFGTQDYNLIASYEPSPLMNIYFTRDQMITTKKGVVMTSMALEQRHAEIKVLKFALRKMGITPIYEVTGGGKLEGGDFITAGNHVYIGQGIRTNAEAIKQLMENDVFGGATVVVVKDSWQKQQEMHLDTYFNIIDRDLVVLERGRYKGTNGKELKADVWVQRNGVYERIQEDVVFPQFLRAMGMKIIIAEESDQKAYGINFLTLESRKIIMLLNINDLSADYLSRLRANNVTIIHVPSDHLKLGFGAAHCTTQVIYRRAPGENTESAAIVDTKSSQKRARQNPKEREKRGAELVR